MSGTKYYTQKARIIYIRKYYYSLSSKDKMGIISKAVEQLFPDMHHFKQFD